MTFLRHVAPAATSFLVVVAKMAGIGITGFVRSTCTEVILWANVSFLMSCFWRVSTDGKTLATAREPVGWFTRLLLGLERSMCLVFLVVSISWASAGSIRVVRTVSELLAYCLYVAGLSYFVIGYLIFRQFQLRRYNPLPNL